MKAPFHDCAEVSIAADYPETEQQLTDQPDREHQP
jgi:hypothetical protein